MLNFRDLTRTFTLRSVQLSKAEIQLLTKRAALEMAGRSTLGAIIVPLCFALAVTASGYIFSSPYTCTCLALALLSCAAVRYLSISRMKKCDDESMGTWLQVFLWGCLGMAAVWGTTAALFIYIYLEDVPVLLILILSAGIGAGSIANFCIWRVLAAMYLLLSFGPGIFVGVFIQRTELLPAILAIAFFVVYLLAQINRWNYHFWDSLLTAYLFERQAEKLSDTNNRMVQVIEKEQKSRREIENARLKIRELFNLTNDVIIICALDGSVLDINKATLEMFSGGREEIMQTSPLQLLEITDRNGLSLQEHWRKVVGGLETNLECKVEQADGQDDLLVQVNLRRVNWQEEQIIFVTLRDITAKKQMEDTLEVTKKFLSESEGYLQAILRNVELPIYCKDLNGCYLTVNESFEQLCCRNLEELRGKNDLQVFPENLGRFLGFRDSEIIATGESLELEGVFAFGDQEKNLLVHKFPLRESGGVIYGTAGICTDVTTMKKALRTAQLANEAKSEFLASMSHELRTPMHSILSVARLGAKRVDRSSQEKLESYFEMIVASGEQLLELLSDLLDLSTLESAKTSYSFGEYDLDQDLVKVVAEFRVMMDERGISLGYQSPGCSAPARYDRTKMYQVLRNLLVNAMKFSAPQKEIKVVLCKDTLAINEDRHSAWKVMVIDQGIGVDNDELKSVFGKFVKGSRTHPGAGGVGLGLSICQRIVEDHKGMIWAEKNEGEGTTFCFLLPALVVSK
ncbi:MAG: ATP-binding protein [Desulforhopalus sp.]